MNDKADPPRKMKDVQALAGTAAKEGLNAIFPGLGSVAGIVLAVVAVVLGVTAATGFCPLYRVFGLSTCPVRTTNASRESVRAS